MVILVRHGRTAANANGIIIGRVDPPLDDVGRRQADAIARALAADDERGVTRVVTSPLARTRDTADAIAAATGVDVEVDERWIELDYGELDGKPDADVPPEVWTRWRGDPTFAPVGGESFVDLGLRVRGACDELAGGGGEGDVVVVSHVSPIKAALAWALGVSDEIAWRTFVAPGSITRIRVGAWGPVLISFNETAHLDE